MGWCLFTRVRPRGGERLRWAPRNTQCWRCGHACRCAALDKRDRGLSAASTVHCLMLMYRHQSPVGQRDHHGNAKASEGPHTHSCGVVRAEGRQQNVAERAHAENKHKVVVHLYTQPHMQITRLTLSFKKKRDDHPHLRSGSGSDSTGTQRPLRPCPSTPAPAPGTVAWAKTQACPQCEQLPKVASSCAPADAWDW